MEGQPKDEEEGNDQRHGEADQEASVLPPEGSNQGNQPRITS
jgi:hypothetical protein